MSSLQGALSVFRVVFKLLRLQHRTNSISESDQKLESNEARSTYFLPAVAVWAFSSVLLLLVVLIVGVEVELSGMVSPAK